MRKRVGGGGKMWVMRRNVERRQRIIVWNMRKYNRKCSEYYLSPRNAHIAHRSLAVFICKGCASTTTIYDEAEVWVQQQLIICRDNKRESWSNKIKYYCYFTIFCRMWNLSHFTYNKRGRLQWQTKKHQAGLCGDKEENFSHNMRRKAHTVPGGKNMYYWSRELVVSWEFVCVLL